MDGKTTKNKPQIETDLDRAREFMEAVGTEKKRRQRENRRSRTVEWVCGIITFVVINGSLVILLSQTGIIELLVDEWQLGYILSGLIIMILWFGFTFLFASSFFWLSDKTGLHYLIEDWVVSWETWDTSQSHNIHNFKKFPRRKRMAFISDFKKKLDVLTDQLYILEEEAEDTDDEKLSDSVESINQVIGSLYIEAEASSRSLISQPYGSFWNGPTNKK